MNYISRYTRLNQEINKWRKKRSLDWKSYHRKFQELVVQHGRTCWERKESLRYKEFIGLAIPEVMYKEIILDMSWAPLKHTHLFRNEDIHFLRELAVPMKHKFFTPREVVFRSNDLKTCLVYIVSGILDVLSEEDCETPVLSLTAGTCLGESTLIISYPSTSSIVSRGVSDVAILEKRDLVKASKLYPKKFRKALRHVQKRYKEGRAFKSLSHYQMTDRSDDNRRGSLTMKWIKITIKGLLYETKIREDIYSRKDTLHLDKHVFCSKYLDMITIAPDAELISDSVFVRNTFPFVFKSESILLDMWNMFIIIVVLILVLTFPYFSVFLPDISFSYNVFCNIITIIWWADLYVKFSTEISTKLLRINRIADILTYNLSRASFIADLIAALPFEILIYAINAYISRHVKIMAQSNRLLKVYKLELFFDMWHSTTSIKVHVKYIKFTLYMLLIYYYVAAVFFRMSCPTYMVCTGWFKRFAERYGLDSPKNILIGTYYSVVQFCSNLYTIPFTYLTDFTSCMVLIVLQAIMTVFNIYFVAHVAAAEAISFRNLHAIEEFSQNLRTTMTCFNVDEDMQRRVWRYVRLQYQSLGMRFLEGDQIFKKLPENLFRIAREIEIGDCIRNVPFLYDLNEVIITHIATICSFHIVPLGEIIKRTGEVCREVHIITDGYCDYICKTGEVGTLGPGDCYSLLETMMKVPSLITIYARTQCKVISFTHNEFMSVMLHYPEVYFQLEEVVSQFKHWCSVMQLEDRSASRTTRKHVDSVSSVKTFVYSPKRSKKYYEYHEGFPKWAFFAKYVLLRCTFRCNSKTVFYWEVTRCFFAIVTNVIVPVTCVKTDWDVLYIVCLCLDVTAYIDIYFRHHVSYYDYRGLEITHPFKTASRYWRRAMVVDLFASFKFQLMTMYLQAQRNFLLMANRVFQLYRVNGLLSMLYKSDESVKGLWILAIYMPVCLLIALYVGATLIYMNCEVSPGKVKCARHFWLLQFGDKNSPFEMFVLSSFFATVLLMNCSVSILKLKTLSDIFIATILGLIGYLGYNYMCAKTIASNLGLNKDLIVYQENMRHLIKFLSYTRVDKQLRNELVNHFEYMWEKTKGKTIHKAFAPFKTSFKVETLYNIYGTKFIESTVFPKPNEGFFKSLLLDAKHEIYLKTGILYAVNDVNDKIFLLLKGQVEVVGADGNRLVTLFVGSVFGNLDNCCLGRRTLSVVASGHVEVLVFSTTEFYAHLKKFPSIRKKFVKLTTFNTDYLEEECWIQKRTTFPRIDPRHVLAEINLHKRAKRQWWKIRVYGRGFFIKLWETVILTVVCFFSFVLATYIVTTKDNSFNVTLFLYFFDVFYVLKIILMFNTAYENEFGMVIFNRRQISLRYLNMKVGFYFDVFTVIPFELAGLLFINGNYYNLVCSIGRANRIARITYSVIYLRDSIQTLNINVFVMRMLYLSLWLTLIQYSLGCLVYILHEFYSILLEDNSKLNNFLYSMKIIINTSTGLPLYLDLNFFTTSLPIWYIFIVIICKSVTIIYTAKTCAILQVVNHTRNWYEQYIVFMKRYVRGENVSGPLADRVLTHIDLLWKYHRGVQFPALLEEAPYYLREAALNSMFGIHLRKHPVFQYCHVDLIRQMASRMRTLIFFPGDVVTYVGDIDQCMYFIHEGEIHALSEDTMHSEVVDLTLVTGNMFGFDQGIKEFSGHEHTYKIVKYTFLVYLKRSDWIFLLDFFPASKMLIFDELKKTSHNV